MKRFASCTFNIAGESFITSDSGIGAATVLICFVLFSIGSSQDGAHFGQAARLVDAVDDTVSDRSRCFEASRVAVEHLYGTGERFLGSAVCQHWTRSLRSGLYKGYISERLVKGGKVLTEVVLVQPVQLSSRAVHHRLAVLEARVERARREHGGRLLAAKASGIVSGVCILVDDRGSGVGGGAALTLERFSVQRCCAGYRVVGTSHVVAKLGGDGDGGRPAFSQAHQRAGRRL